MKRMNYLAVMLTTALLSLAQPVLGLDVRLGDSAGNTPAAATSGPPLMASLQLLTEKPGQGEPVLFELLLRLQPGVAIGAGTTLTSLGEWEVVRVAPGPLLNDRNGQAVRKDQLTLRTFASGKVDVPAWIQPYRGADGQAGEFRTAPLTVTVEPVPGQPGDRPGEIRPLKPPRYLFAPWPWALGAALALLVLAGAWWWSRRGRAETGAVAVAPGRPADEVAREQLELLKQSAWLSQGDFKAYYVSLSLILRTYLEGCFRVPARDQTTPELLKSLKQARAKLQDVNAAREVLNRSDLVKFAKWLPVAAEAQADWQAVWELVERTAPRPEPEEDPRASG